MSLAPFGTAHEALEDEKNTAVSRKPKQVQDEIVTDEKGRRRFHGAFTGGFSAGYFNTVGSRHGWVPQTFKSSRDERNEKLNITARDFMDDEDRGEFGFAARKIRTRDDFTDRVTGTTEKLAWERSDRPSTSATAGLSDLAAHLAHSIHPVNDSIGVKILRKMGWRPGKGIGPRMSRRALEKSKVADARAHGRHSRFDDEAVQEAEELAPTMEFAPDDIPRLFFIQNAGSHGLGYKPLEHSSALDEEFAFKVDAYKTTNKSKGIRGQAFGVGAFEDDDDEIYTSEDLSKYDYAIGGTDSNIREVERYDSIFVPSKVVELPPYYKAPNAPRHFDLQHKPTGIQLKDMPSTMIDSIKTLTPLQRAVFLGDRSSNIMELLSDKDRQKLNELSRKTQKETVKKKEEEKPAKAANPFEEEPMKAHRFNKYIHYLKSGFDMPPPTEMTRLEWERELKEFESQLTPELRTLLPSVRSRQEPLAKLSTAQPLADLLKSRFTGESGKTDDTKTTSKFETDRREAVKNKRFGAMTRTRYTWHPSKLLSKYFDLEDPYPSSQMVGTLELQKRVPMSTPSSAHDALGNLGLPNTQRDVIERLGKEAQDRRQGENKEKSRWDNDPFSKKMEEKLQSEGADAEAEEKPQFLPPINFLQSVFQIAEEESSSSDSEIEEITVERKGPERKNVAAATTSGQQEKMVTIMDLMPDEEYGPQVPERLPEELPPEVKTMIVPVAPEMEVILSSDTSSSSSRSSSPAPKKRKKHKKKHKKHHKSKSKKSKSKKRQKHSSFSGSD